MNISLSLQENASSEEHVVYVWDHFVSKAEAKNVFIVAHSYGGLSFVELVSSYLFCFFSYFLTLCVLNDQTERITNTHDRIALSTSEH